MTVSLSDRLTPVANVIFRALGEESVVLSLDAGLYFGLDEVGTRIWTLIEHHDLAGVAAVLAREYDVGRDEVEQDVMAFARELQARGLVDQRGDA